jgi:hypothetical protein
MSTAVPGGKLIAAAEAVDVMDAAGRIIANPVRQAPAATAAEVLALAWTAEGLNAIAIEAGLLIRALKLPITGNDSQDAARDHAAYVQIATLERQFALLYAHPETSTEKE